MTFFAPELKRCEKDGVLGAVDLAELMSRESNEGQEIRLFVLGGGAVEKTESSTRRLLVARRYRRRDGRRRYCVEATRVAARMRRSLLARDSVGAVGNDPSALKMMTLTRKPRAFACR